MTVAALYIDPRGPYPSMPDVECWGLPARDAREYAGPHPVVAHPPCGPWSSLRHLYSGRDADCAPLALAAVRRFGGIFEHPATSTFLRDNAPGPGELPDHVNGFSVVVDQVSWGHVARKSTLLYCVGVDRALLFATLRTVGTPTHWCSGSRNAPRGPVPPGIKVCSAQQRRRTPPAFARWLVDLAASAQRTRAA